MEVQEVNLEGRDQDFKIIFGCIASSKPARGYLKPCVAGEVHLRLISSVQKSRMSKEREKKLGSERTALPKSFTVFTSTDPSGKGGSSSWGTGIHSQEVSAMDKCFSGELMALLPVLQSSKVKPSICLCRTDSSKS